MKSQASPPIDALLAKVRALLAKAEDPAATAAEADAFTAKAAELMAKYGIEQAMLGDRDPGSDLPGDKVVTVHNPWAGEKAKLLYWLAEAMRCKSVMLGKRDGTARVHIFGFRSDLERVEVLYTSLLLQMTGGLAKVRVPSYESSRAFRRSWLLGFVDEVTHRVRDAERRAADQAPAPEVGRSTAVVLADRAQIVARNFAEQYPQTRKGRTTYTGGGYGVGRAAGRTANIGHSGLGRGRRALGGNR